MRYARAARYAVGSAAAVDAELRTVLRRRDALLAQLRPRGVDFGDDRVGPGGPERQDPSTPATRSPDPEQAAPVDLVAKLEQLERGMVTRTVMGQAQGILIERHRVTADAAFRMLVASQTSNRKLRDIAADLVAAGRIVLEQAKGVLAYVGKVDMEDAFAVLRRYARDRGVKLSDVASRIVNRELPSEAVIDHARSATILP